MAKKVGISSKQLDPKNNPEIEVKSTEKEVSTNTFGAKGETRNKEEVVSEEEQQEKTEEVKMSDSEAELVEKIAHLDTEEPLAEKDHDYGTNDDLENFDTIRVKHQQTDYMEVIGDVYDLYEENLHHDNPTKSKTEVVEKKQTIPVEEKEQDNQKKDKDNDTDTDIES